jgi:hypothetical protein
MPANGTNSMARAITALIMIVRFICDLLSRWKRVLQRLYFTINLESVNPQITVLLVRTLTRAEAPQEKGLGAG